MPVGGSPTGTRRDTIPFMRSLLHIFLILLFPAVIAAEPGSIPEILHYDLSWTGIPVGSALQSITREGGDIRIRASFASNSWLSRIHRVDNAIETTLRPAAGFFPGEVQEFHLRLTEGPLQRDRRITFDHRRNIARFRDHITGEEGTASIEPGTTDVTTAFYHARVLPLVPGDSFELPVIDGKEPYRLTVRVLRRESINTIFGKTPTIVVEPLIRPEGTFEGKRGVTLWVTDDRRRIPVRIRTKVTVGSVTASLVAME